MSNTIFMQDADSHTSHWLDKLGQEQLQHILDKFSPLILSPLLILDAHGERLAVLHDEHICSEQSLSVQVNHEDRIVQGEFHDPTSPYSTLLNVPVDIHGEVVGYVALCVGSEDAKEHEHRYLLRLIADFISEKAYSEFELENLTEELVEKFNEVNLIYDISEALGAVLDPITVCNVIIEKAVGVIGVEKASIMLYDEKRGHLYIAASHGIDLSAGEMRSIVVNPGEGVSGKVFSTGKHLLIEDIEHTQLPDIPHLYRDEQVKSSQASLQRGYKKKSFLSIPMICTPRKMEKKVMGVINMTDKHSSEMFTSGDLRLLSAIAAQAAMSLYNIQLIEEVKDAERVKREMEIAQQIQRSLLPGGPPNLSGVEVAGQCLPATQVGGDYYDFFLNSDQKIGVVIADVSGHNVGAALMMAVARSTLRSEVLTQNSPSKILEKTNLILYEDLTRSELFITMFYAEYDLQSRTLRYSNGGHNHPILLRNSESHFLNTEGMLIGMLESVDFEEKSIELQYGDFVIFYTDGVVETVNERGEMFKVHRLCQTIEANTQCSASGLMTAIYEALERFSGSTLRSDDITVVVLKIC